MELKPTRDKLGSRGPKASTRLDGMGRVLGPDEHKNPFASLERGLAPRGAKRRRWDADTLGATPPRDGPFQMGAADIAVTKPPRGRARRRRDPQLPFPIVKA